MISAAPWLAAFTGSEYDVQNAINALHTSPNGCTRLLTRYLILLTNYAIMAQWKMEALQIVRRRTNEKEFYLPEENAKHVSSYTKRQCERGDMVVGYLWKALRKAVETYPLSNEYQVISSKVANFVLLAGCPSLGQGPLKNI